MTLSVPAPSPRSYDWGAGDLEPTPRVPKRTHEPGPIRSRLPPPIAEVAEARLAKLIERAQEGATLVAPATGLLAANAAFPAFSWPLAAFFAITLTAVAVWNRTVANAATLALAAPAFAIHTGGGAAWFAGYAAYAFSLAFLAHLEERGTVTIALILVTVALLGTDLSPLAVLSIAALALYGRETLRLRIPLAIAGVLTAHFLLASATWQASGRLEVPPLLGPLPGLATGFGGPDGPATLRDAFATWAGANVSTAAYFSQVWIGQVAVGVVAAIVVGAAGAALLAAKGITALATAGKARAASLLAFAGPIAAAAAFTSLIILLLDRPSLPITLDGGLAFGVIALGMLVAGGSHSGAAFLIEARREAIRVQAVVEAESRATDAELSASEEAFSRAKTLIPTIDLAEPNAELQALADVLRENAVPAGRLTTREATLRLSAVRGVVPRLDAARDAGITKFRREVARVRDELGQFARAIPALGLGDANALRVSDTDLTDLSFGDLCDRMASYRARLAAALQPVSKRAEFTDGFVRSRISPTFNSASFNHGKEVRETAPELALGAFLEHLRSSDERFLVRCQAFEQAAVSAAKRYIVVYAEVRALLGSELPSDEDALLSRALDHAKRIAELEKDASAFPVRHVYQMEARPTADAEGGFPFGLLRLRMILEAERTAIELRAPGLESAATRRLPEIPKWKLEVADEIALFVAEEGEGGLLSLYTTEEKALAQEAQRSDQITDNQQIQITYRAVEGAIGRLLRVAGRVLHSDIPVRKSVQGEYLRRFANEHPEVVEYDPATGISRRGSA